MKKNLTLQFIGKEYKDEYGYNSVPIDNISLSVPDNKITGIFGNRKSGKTTLMKIMAGLEEISFGGFDNSFEKIVYIPENPSSFPWMNVFDNVTYLLKGYGREEIEEIIKYVGLEGYEEHFPNNNSLGFRLRITLARALAHGADLILIDNSLSLMDSITKMEILRLIRKINEEKEIAICYSSSMFFDTVALSDKLYILGDNSAGISEEIEIELPKEREELFDSVEKINSEIARLDSVIIDKLKFGAFQFS